MRSPHSRASPAPSLRPPVHSCCRHKKEKKRHSHSRSRSRSASPADRKRQHGNGRQRSREQEDVPPPLLPPAPQEGDTAAQQMSAEEVAAWEAAARVAEAQDVAGGAEADSELAGYNPAAYDWDAFLEDEGGGGGGGDQQHLEHGQGNGLAVRDVAPEPVTAGANAKGHSILALPEAKQLFLPSVPSPSTPPEEGKDACLLAGGS